LGRCKVFFFTTKTTANNHGTMANRKQKTELKNFRLPSSICRWLKKQKAITGISQTRLVMDALESKYRLKGRTA
jgi:hypothetical protein